MLSLSDSQLALILPLIDREISELEDLLDSNSSYCEEDKADFRDAIDNLTIVRRKLQFKAGGHTHCKH